MKLLVLLIFPGINSSLKEMLEFEVEVDEKRLNAESDASYSLWLKERLLRIVQKSVNRGDIFR